MRAACGCESFEGCRREDRFLHSLVGWIVLGLFILVHACYFTKNPSSTAFFIPMNGWWWVLIISAVLGIFRRKFYQMDINWPKVQFGTKSGHMKGDA